MRALLGYIMRGRLQAAGAATVLGLLTWIIPLLSYLSGGVVGLATLRHGVMEGLKVTGIGVVILAVFSLLMLQSAAPVSAVAIGVWLPACGAAWLLRRTQDQGVLLAGVGLLGAVVSLVLRLYYTDVSEMWRQGLLQVIHAMGQRGVPPPAQSSVDSLAVLMNSLVAGTLVMSLMLTTLLARWWQALLYNAGGFRVEFHRLQLPRPVAWVTVAILVAGVVRAGMGARDFGIDLFVIALVMFMFQGLAVIHYRLRSVNRAIAWLVALYLGLFLVPQFMLLAVVAVGVADVLLDIRRLRRPQDGTGTAA